ncbi:MFS transporter [Rugosimonospora africana]|uniref:MFS transporter n=1 Tax=Rugosimonospora africana TaxID=556532 RepID=A0A8J3QN34_9ACTN|nr:MFS transporter [Rugosimonospora africana]GIH12949.1 MFS transporter [Rugosimonospora africana]
MTVTDITDQPIRPGAARQDTGRQDTGRQDTGRLGPPDAAERPPRRGLLPVMLAGVFMTSLDVFIVNVAIPATERQLHAGPGAVQWIVAGFGLAVAAGVITGGRLGDLYGRRRMYALGMALFTLASAACGLAPSPGALIAARVAQGVAAAIMSPQALAILGTALTGRALHRAVSAYGMAMGLAAVFGQLIGGVLIEANPLGLSWRSCFLVNLPVGALALVLIPRVVPESRGTGRSRLDLVGVFLVTLALVASVLPLIQAGSTGWPAWTWPCFGAAGVLFAAFIGYQLRLSRRGGEPLIEPALFRMRTFSVGLLTQLVFWTGLGSFFLVFALYIQQGRGRSPLGAGLIFTAIGAGYLATSTTSHRIAARLGRWTVPAGTLLMAAGLALLWEVVGRSGTHGSPFWLVPPLVIDGIGMGMTLSPLVTTSMTGMPPRHAGAASGVLSTTMQVGGALGVSVVGVVFYRALAGGHPHAFQASLVYLIGVALATAALIQFLPRDRSGREQARIGR